VYVLLRALQMATDWEIMAIIQLARLSSDPRVLRRLCWDWSDRFECLLERLAGSLYSNGSSLDEVSDSRRLVVLEPFVQQGSRLLAQPVVLSQCNFTCETKGLPETYVDREYSSLAFTSLSFASLITSSLFSFVQSFAFRKYVAPYRKVSMSPVMPQVLT
jgi:hypothetical protein